jgi:uncharacterized membrane protein
MFEFLFKYPPVVFSRGTLVLLGVWPHWLLPALIALASAGLALAIRVRFADSAAKLRSGRLALIWLLQALSAAILLVLLWRPAVAISELKPQQNIVAILIDDSRSMGVSEDGVTRAQQASRALQSGVLIDLQRKFQTRLYRFDTVVTPVELEQLGSAAAPATHIGASLEQLVTQTADLPLGAIIMLSDGGDNSGAIDRGALDALRNRHIPVYTVGFGAERVAQDVELEDVALPSRAPANSRLKATLRFQQRGFAGRQVTLAVRDGQQVLASRQVALAADGQMQIEELQFNVGAAGAKTLQFAVEPLADELSRDNNALTRLVNVEPEPRRILYFEGEPRWEYKFIGRAANDDPMLQLVSMLRTTENKIYRQGIKDPQQLADGFPTRARDLFEYQAVIIGSVDAGYFSPAQQQLLHEFVDRRGGGLLLLGGRQSLADGVWGGSQIADLLPVTLPQTQNTFHRDPATVSLTVAGEDSVICRLVDDPALNLQSWRNLPYLMDYQDAGSPKAGATVLAQMHAKGRTLPLLVTQNYGQGRVAVLATGGTWRWQMSMPLGDKSHDLFWQQLLRWLVADSRGRLMASVATPTLLDDGHVQIGADVRDSDYHPAADVRVTAHVIGPSGSAAELDFTAVPNAPGRFQADWVAPVPGLYVTEVGARRGAEDMGGDVVAFQRLDGVAESFHTEQNRDLLEQLAASTGGRYVRPQELRGLADSIPYSAAGVTTQQLKELWNMPIVFVLILSLRCAEWLLRRKWGII